MQYRSQDVAGLPIDTAAIAAVPSTVRARVTNGRKLLDGVDGRSATARRFRDLVDAYSEALGPSPITAAQTALVKQAAAVTVQSEALQAAVVRGDAVDPDELIRVSNTLGRLVRSLTPAPALREEQRLSDYLRQRGEVSS